MDKGYIIEDAVCTASTPNAIRVAAPELDEETWFPKSVIHDHSEVYGNGNEGSLIIDTWWAKKQGFR